MAILDKKLTVSAFEKIVGRKATSSEISGLKRGSISRVFLKGRGYDINLNAEEKKLYEEDEKRYENELKNRNKEGGEFLTESLRPIPPEPTTWIKSDLTKTSNLDDDIQVFKTVGIIPTETPQSNLEKIQIFSSGTTYRIYAWDETNEDWKYSALT